MNESATTFDEDVFTVGKRMENKNKNRDNNILPSMYNTTYIS